jgi:hypothetical protein
VNDVLLGHIAPLGWNHMGLTGDYNWHALTLNNTANNNKRRGLNPSAILALAASRKALLAPYAPQIAGASAI